uniref:Integrase n=1 Tax=Muribaculaceae bacterium Z82 TaxID=2304548 RepID=A0A7C9JEV2_9BACT
MTDHPDLLHDGEPAEAGTIARFFEREFVPYLYDTASDRVREALMGTMRLHVLPVAGGLSVAGATRADVQAVCKAQSDGESSTACRNALHALFEYAMHKGVRRNNPASIARIDRMDRATRPRCLYLPTFRQIETLIDLASAKRAQPAAALSIALGYGCGLTLKAMKSLRCEGLDLVRLRITLGEGGCLPVVPSIAARLAKIAPQGCEYVLSGSGGAPYDTASVRHALDKFCLSEKLPPVDFDAMRESFASALLNEGATSHQAALYLGVEPKVVRAMAERGDKRAMEAAIGVTPLR